MCRILPLREFSHRISVNFTVLLAQNSYFVYYLCVKYGTTFTRKSIKLEVDFWLRFTLSNANFSRCIDREFLRPLADVSQSQISISASETRRVGSQTNATTGLRKLILISRYRQIARHKSKAKKPSAKTLLRNRR